MYFEWSHRIFSIMTGKILLIRHQSMRSHNTSSSYPRTLDKAFTQQPRCHFHPPQVLWCSFSGPCVFFISLYQNYLQTCLFQMQHYQIVLSSVLLYCFCFFPSSLLVMLTVVSSWLTFSQQRFFVLLQCNQIVLSWIISLFLLHLWIFCRGAPISKPSSIQDDG